MAALEALAQVHPGVTRFEAFLAAVDFIEAGDGNGRQVSASVWHRLVARERVWRSTWYSTPAAFECGQDFSPAYQPSSAVRS